LVRGLTLVALHTLKRVGLICQVHTKWTGSHRRLSNRSGVVELIYTVIVATLVGWLYFRRRCSISIHPVQKLVANVTTAHKVILQAYHGKQISL